MTAKSGEALDPKAAILNILQRVMEQEDERSNLNAVARCLATYVFETAQTIETLEAEISCLKDQIYGFDSPPPGASMTVHELEVVTNRSQRRLNNAAEG